MEIVVDGTGKPLSAVPEDNVEYLAIVKTAAVLGSDPDITRETITRFFVEKQKIEDARDAAVSVFVRQHDAELLTQIRETDHSGGPTQT